MQNLMIGVNKLLKTYYEAKSFLGIGGDSENKAMLNSLNTTIKLREAAIDASNKSFGHSGFTGTYCWADPENGILFVFMSNRIYPTRNNSKLYQLNIRPAIHQVFYDACKNSKL